jgi:hypothetical protein
MGFFFFAMAQGSDPILFAFADIPCSLSKQSGDPACGAAEMKGEANRAEAH